MFEIFLIFGQITHHNKNEFSSMNAQLYSYSYDKFLF